VKKPISFIKFHGTNLMFSIRRGLPILLSLLLVPGSLITITGCEQKEKVVDIETPAGNIEVERSKSNGKVDVDIKVDRKQ